MTQKNTKQTKSEGNVEKVQDKLVEKKAKPDAKDVKDAKDAKKAKKSVGKKAGKKVMPGEEKPASSKNRSFKVIYVDPNGEVVVEGRYCGAKPKQAACKALTGIYKIFKDEEKELKDEVKFGVCETTRGSRNKKYWYSGKKEGLETSIQLYLLPNSDTTASLIKKWEIKKEAKRADDEKKKVESMTAEQKQKYNEKKALKEDKDEKKEKKSDKRYFSAEKIEEIGGFKKLFGKEQKDVKPAITYNYANNVSKASSSDCQHLNVAHKIEDNNSDSDVEDEIKLTGGSKKASEKASEKATEKVSKKATEKATEKVSKKATEKVSKKATEKTTEKTTEKKPKKVAEEKK